MIRTHVLGFPRIGANREFKKAAESYWRDEISRTELKKIGLKIQHYGWKIQAEAGLDYITVGDFSWYDHVLDTSILFGVIPQRFGQLADKDPNVDTAFYMARGKAFGKRDVPACEMTKWFNTNYHYIVPEFTKDQSFSLNPAALLDSIQYAKSLGYHALKPVLLGPLTYLWLGKEHDKDFNKLDLLNKILPVYNQLFNLLSAE